MSRFLEIALRNAARGLRVFPVHAKLPLVKNFPDLATTDPAHIEQWAQKWPDANCGVMGDDTFLIVDTDRWAKMQELFAEQLRDPALFDTYCVSAREDRRQFTFLQTERSRAMQKRNLDCAVPGEPDNVFEFKSRRKFGMGEGSIHKTGKTYLIVQDRPFKPVPDALIERAEELYRSLKQESPDGSRQSLPLDNGSRHNALVQVAGSLRRAGLGSAAIEVALLQHCADSLTDDTDFNVEDECKSIAASATWPIPEPEGKVFIGSSQPEEKIEEATGAGALRKLPDYPLHVWEGTIYHEFALRAASVCYVPSEIFLETLLTCVGAAVANQLTCELSNVTSRFFTTLIALAGSGKGSAQNLVLDTMLQPVRLSSTFFSEANLPRPCSALLARAASEAGLNIAFCNHASVLFDLEEIDQLMEKTSIQGSGKSLLGVIRNLHDSERPGFSIASKRTDIAPLGRLSILGSMTPSIWRDAMQGKDAYGTGIGGRLNLIVTGPVKTKAQLRWPDFGDLAERLEQKFFALDAGPIRMTQEPEADAVFSRWWETLTSGQWGRACGRVNVITQRKALHLAWMLGQTSITADVAEKAILLGNYLVEARQSVMVEEGGEKQAVNENVVLAAVRDAHPKALSAATICVFVDHAMSRRSIYNALSMLVETGEVRKIKGAPGKNGRPATLYVWNLVGRS